MKTWKTIALSVITTSALATGSALTYSHLQPSHYKGDTFTNAKTSVSTTTTTSTSSSSISQSESTYDSDTNNYYVYTESNSAEVTSDPYNLLNTYIDNMHKVVEYYNGYYIVTEECQTGYGTKYIYIVYNPETGELTPNGSDMIQEQRNWIDNYGNTQQTQSTETDEE